ncbi:ImmA/IrrE family metallo-endopeptidase [Geodermatophilus sp. DF01-2]|uniref:ImmA/IrrE family metallo-endopeptidase n=1 Tax=Geodermatophilus sp. DF01-2 TaxID=2559610 RepID=UPI0010735696|nr:ImmA/IrrE family metallo-endopeptidase [Geodermatophilus sp. DF01_2]TFV57740.1 ImmA/IrrE family metallo-endopeptidase [Geodermatophilus sp. DF01_2]
MKRGFGSTARALAIEVRAEVGLTPHAVLDPLLIADEYGIDVYRLSDTDCDQAALRHFLVDRPDAFSGALIPLGDGVVILENDEHSPVRRKSTLCHELAHVLLEHPFTTRLVGDTGCRLTNRDLEEEAAFLSGELMIPREAALRLAWRDATDEMVSAKHQISVEAARWRMNASGARKIVERSRRKSRPER